jgi:phosphoribosylformylglycinamidine (FGAM) synthase-like enzyme
VLANDRLIRSAHDCSDGGLAVTVAECCFDTGGVGAQVSVAGVQVSGAADVNDAAALFGESASRVVLSATPDNVAGILAHAAAASVPARVVGKTGGNRLRVAVDNRVTIDLAVDDAERAWSSAIETSIATRVA